MAAPYLAAVRAMARFIRASLCCPAAGGQDQSRGMWVTPSLWLVVWKCVGTDMSHLSLSLCISAMAAPATRGAHLKPQWPFGLSVGPATTPPLPTPAVGRRAGPRKEGEGNVGIRSGRINGLNLPGADWRRLLLFFLLLCVTRNTYFCSVTINIYVMYGF